MVSAIGRVSVIHTDMDMNAIIDSLSADTCGRLISTPCSGRDCSGRGGRRDTRSLPEGGHIAVRVSQQQSCRRVDPCPLLSPALDGWPAPLPGPGGHARQETESAASLGA